MKITIEFNENDVKQHRTEIVEALLQITDIGYVAQTNVQKSEPEQKQQATQQNIPQYDMEKLQKAANEKAKQIENGVEKVRALIKKYGAETLPQIDKKQYAAFLKELRELV